ncbi:MAG TPA: hypothetical protein VII00_07025 [bacterium]
MLRHLHIIRAPLSGLPAEFLKERPGENGSAIVLVGDGVYAEELNGKSIYFIDEDAKSRGVELKNYKPLHYEDLVRLIFENDRIFLW